MIQNLKWLYWGRGLRSCSTAFLIVAFPLYLAVSGYNAARLGLVLGAAGGVTLRLVMLASGSRLLDTGDFCSADR